MTSHHSRFSQPAASCPQCLSLRGMNREYWREIEREPLAMVRTWCRVCGNSSLVGLPLRYSRALEVAHWIDDQVMDHEDHSETGGWGVHFRLDAALRAVFPSLHLEEVFPMPIWYPHRTEPEMELSILRVVKKNGVDRIL